MRSLSIITMGLTVGLLLVSAATPSNGPNLRTYFKRNGWDLPLSKATQDYQPGDLVTCIVPPNLPHIMVVSDRTNAPGQPLVIHNIGAGTQEEDRLFAFKITGHYRIKRTESGGPANGRQPSRSDTNRTPNAGGGYLPSLTVDTCTLARLDLTNRRAELGFALGRAFWGRGDMEAALPAVVEFAFGRLGLHRVVADTDPRNIPSIRTLERLGFLREGLLRQHYLVKGEAQDAVVYGLLRSEWARIAEPGNSPSGGPAA